MRAVAGDGGRTGGRGQRGCGKKGAKRPEHLANRVKRKAPNGGFGQGIVVCGGIHRETPQREKYLSCPLCQGISLGNSCSGFCLGLLRGQVYSKTRMRPSNSMIGKSGPATVTSWSTQPTTLATKRTHTPRSVPSINSTPAPAGPNSST